MSIFGRGANACSQFWINDVATDAEAHTAQATEAPAAAAAKIDRAALMQQWIVAPTDPVLASAPCPICKEKFTSEYSEDEEEWIWRNAVKADNKVIPPDRTRCEKLADQFLPRPASPLMTHPVRWPYLPLHDFVWFVSKLFATSPSFGPDHASSDLSRHV